MEFIPDDNTTTDVPFFDDVLSQDGWHGHTTTKSIDQLRSEIVTAVNRLNGTIARFQSGRYLIGGQERDGYCLHFIAQGKDGRSYPSRLDIAALPVKTGKASAGSYEKRRDKARRQALFMLRDALYGMWYLQQLAPGYAALLPWMLDRRTGKTFGQLWIETGFNGNLLPAGDIQTAEGEFEAEE